MNRAAIAIGAHPDDIEFYMAGTLLLLKQVGYDIHYLNVASGDCGTVEHSRSKTRSIREREARTAAKILGAHFHPSLTDDLQIFYNQELLQGLAALIRVAQPSIVLTHAPQDYMEDHTNTCRLAVTAAFTRSMPNFKTKPSRPVAEYEVTIYHAMPHGFRDQLRRRVVPGLFVNTTSTHPMKLKALSEHKSQQNWLELSQGMNSYLRTMEEASLKLGKMSKRYKHAEGWRRHLHYGFCAADADPLAAALGNNCFVNRSYERGLKASEA
jgi:LmbE family N-acetylglucosaminyl deacetylase